MTPVGTPTASDVRTELMNKGLQRYLNDHLAGSEVALKLVDHLIKSTEGEHGNGFLRGLRRTIRDDQSRLRDLMKAADVEPSALLRLAGNIAGATGRMKLRIDPNGLGTFEALEMLALGIQGKRLLWRILDEISSHYPQWKEVDFIKLERDAVVQRNAVEMLRQEAGRETLIC